MAIAGILGFVMNPVLGVFAAGSTLSALWLVAGVITLAVAMWMPGSMSLWSKILGIILAIVTILGFVISGPVLGMLDNTMADNVLHLVLAVLFLWMGFMSSSRSMDSMPTQSAM
jgi:uncharacterized membrane protein HdeD (DUF308 family)